MDEKSIAKIIRGYALTYDQLELALAVSIKFAGLNVEQIVVLLSEAKNGERK
jgi:hypothetical protein